MSLVGSSGTCWEHRELDLDMDGETIRGMGGSALCS